MNWRLGCQLTIFKAFLLMTSVFPPLASAENEEAKYLTGERTWTSADGKTISGRLLPGEGEVSSSAIFDGKVRISVNGMIYDLPLDRLSPADQDFVKGLIPVSPSKPLSFPKNFEAKLVNRTFEGKFLYKNHFSHVFPTFAAPKVVIERFKFTAGTFSESEGGEMGLEIDGSFHSALTEAMGSNGSPIKHGWLYVNGEDEPSALLSIDGSSGEERNWAKGTFHAKVDKVGVTEGVNVLRVAFPDPITRIEGSETISFALTFDPSGPKIENVENLNRSRDGESFPYFIVVENVPPSEAAGLRLEIGRPDSGAVFDLKPVSAEGALLMVAEGSSQAAGFSLLPSREPANPERIAALKKAFDLIRARTDVSERDQWLTGFTRGLFLHGADLVLGDGRVVERAAELSDDATVLEMKCRWVKEGGKSDDFVVNLTPPLVEQAAIAEGKDTCPEIFWQLAKLYREKDPKTEEATLALLTGDLGSIGLEGIVLSGWREDFFMKIAEPLHDVNEGFSEMIPVAHGGVVGMLVGVAAQIDLPPILRGDGNEKPGARPTKAEVLEYLVERF